MPGASHRNCARCHRVRVDKRAAFGMCQRCKKIFIRERREMRHKTRVRQQRAQGVATVAEEPTPTVPDVAPEPSPNGTHKHDRLAHMSDEHKLIIAGHYANYEIPVEAIVRQYGISNGDVTRVADELGIPRRDRRNVGRRLPFGRFENDVWKVFPEERTPETEPEPDPIPEPMHKALENLIKLPPPPEPPVRRTPPVPTPLGMPVTIAVDSGTERWEISVEGLILASGGAEIEDVLARIRTLYPSLRVKGIRQQ